MRGMDRVWRCKGRNRACIFDWYTLGTYLGQYSQQLSSVDQFMPERLIVSRLCFRGRVPTDYDYTVRQPVLLMDVDEIILICLDLLSSLPQRC